MVQNIGQKKDHNMCPFKIFLFYKRYKTQFIPLILSEEASFAFLFWLGDFSFSWQS